ncbi:rod shape-determining protein MreC [Kribbella sp. ALI-6-A]|uniref:rod shape-determining protein MreC n=1 Tax=Kribbella sp. ALI-6-A TaxID=1933817 RepID=UPI00097CB4DC|nr:rod shape-determining protein MreC [Kribbella sp. ALI-6-A]ONI76555.1 rod shape-determining protein MreC [Kribbella sp. ALI-6-A]
MLKDLGTPARGLVRAAGLPREIRRRRTVLVLVVLASLTLIVLDARRSAGSPVDPLRHAAATVFGPLESGATSARQPVDNLRDRFAELDRLKAENEKLQAENEKLTTELLTTDYTRNRAAELDRLLKVAPAYTVTPARVIGIGGAQSFQHTVTIDAGTADGVRPDMTVLNGDGLVGRVVRATDATATVLLIGDRNSTVGGRLNSTLALGFLSGRGEIGGTLDYKLVDLRARPKVGDRIVTWGSRGNAPYVPGVPIGTVTSVTPNQGTLGSTATVKPFVDPTRIDTVGVVTGPPARPPRGTVTPEQGR